MVDICVGEFEFLILYFYLIYEMENELKKLQCFSVFVLGFGLICIGQGIEFDYVIVYFVKVIQVVGYEVIIMNLNLEMVFIDFFIFDKLYFELLIFEDVMNVVDFEQFDGVIVQFGGQMVINLVGLFLVVGVLILGIQVVDFDCVEDWEGFEFLFVELGIL